MRPVFVRLSVKPATRVQVIGTIVFCAGLSALFMAGVLAPSSPDARHLVTSMRTAVMVIKSCGGRLPPSVGHGGGPGSIQVVPGSPSWECSTLAQLIDQAYTEPTTPPLNRVLSARHADAASFKRVRGGPAWVDGDGFKVDVTLSGDDGALQAAATAENLARVREAIKPALRTLLEDRFQLSLHRATEGIPVYKLRVGDGGREGLRIARATFTDCYSSTTGVVQTPPPGFEGKPPCATSKASREGGHWTRVYIGITMAELAGELSTLTDRIALDETGLDDRYNFAIEYVPDEHTPERPSNAPDLLALLTPPIVPPGVGPSIFAALDFLGLTLSAATEPAEYLQIDSIQPLQTADPGDQIPGRAVGPGKPGR